MEDGEKYFVQVSGETGSPTEVRGPLVAGDSVHLRIDADFLRQNDKAYFYFSGDGIGWARLGETLQMQYTSIISWALGSACSTSRQKKPVDS